ncbi:hypothetical protein PROFUN_06871 [Planoprotostelium fungivorum]|uniref:non-specific serine/threonine protein kinase n=1 Tax=Planoprotostelium fungivorum TaxID=1890364 RepID=A0A2P6NNI3_9EUKA|nr:hypothetical protein PROFUN_06871 [Planoprotostelium fungivorum]
MDSRRGPDEDDELLLNVFEEGPQTQEQKVYAQPDREEAADALSYWKKKSQQYCSTNEAMLLIGSHQFKREKLKLKFEEKERDEILSVLGIHFPDRNSSRKDAPSFWHRPLSEWDVIDLGAGIGRYTPAFATLCASIHSVDFVQEFIDKNQQVNGALYPDKTSFTCSDAFLIENNDESLDLVFSNWLLLYMSDEQVPILVEKWFQWLRPGGLLFFRESCHTSIGGNDATGDSPARYRNPEFYHDLFSKRFHLIKEGNVKLYERIYSSGTSYLCNPHVKPSKSSGAHHRRSAAAVKRMEDEDKGRYPPVIGEWVVGKTLGQGSFGKVKLGTHQRTGKKVALKLIEHAQASAKDLINIEREGRIMGLLDHPNIVRLFEIIEMADKKTTCLVLEFVEGGELFDYIVANRRLKEPEAIRFFRQVISAVEYCHSNLVIHRDLKPENLLLDADKNIKINDFGLSNLMNPGNFLETYCGSPLYSSPEIIMETNYMGPEVDIWALGVILYAMVTGYLPWDGDEVKEQVKNAVKANYELPDHVSTECKQLIGRMLTVDPKKRATIAEVRQSAWVNRGYASLPQSCLPVRTALAESDIDKTILKKMEDLGFTAKEITADLMANKTSSNALVMYYLMFDRAERDRNEKGSFSPSRRISSLSLVDNSSHGSIESDEMRSPNGRPKSVNLSNVSNSISIGHSPSGSPKSGGGTIRTKSPLLSIFKRDKDPRQQYRGSYDPEMGDIKPADAEGKLRVAKGAFTFETTTNRPLQEITEELERVLGAMGMLWKRGKRGHSYKVKLIKKNLKLEIEICKVEKMEGLKGIKFKRVRGDTWEYKNLYQQICQNLKL